MDVWTKDLRRTEGTAAATPRTSFAAAGSPRQSFSSYPAKVPPRTEQEQLLGDLRTSCKVLEGQLRDLRREHAQQIQTIRQETSALKNCLLRVGVLPADELEKDLKLLAANSSRGASDTRRPEVPRSSSPAAGGDFARSPDAPGAFSPPSTPRSSRSPRPHAEGTSSRRAPSSGKERSVDGNSPTDADSVVDADLYKVMRPLLQRADSRSGRTTQEQFAEQQRALRATNQCLKSSPEPPNSWTGPGTPLNTAVQANRPNLVRALLEARAGVNLSDAKGVTALHTASFEGNGEMCRILMIARAQVNACDRHGQTPLFFAPKKDICKMLMEKHADVAILNCKGQSALHLAGRAGLRDVLEWLTSQVSRPLTEVRDMHGATAQHYALQAGLVMPEAPSSGHTSQRKSPVPSANPVLRRAATVGSLLSPGASGGGAASSEATPRSTPAQSPRPAAGPGPGGTRSSLPRARSAQSVQREAAGDDGAAVAEGASSALAMGMRPSAIPRKIIPGSRARPRPSTGSPTVPPGSGVASAGAGASSAPAASAGGGGGGRQESSVAVAPVPAGASTNAGKELLASSLDAQASKSSEDLSLQAAGVPQLGPSAESQTQVFHINGQDSDNSGPPGEGGDAAETVKARTRTDSNPVPQPTIEEVYSSLGRRSVEEASAKAAAAPSGGDQPAKEVEDKRKSLRTQQAEAEEAAFLAELGVFADVQDMPTVPHEAGEDEGGEANQEEEEDEEEEEEADEAEDQEVAMDKTRTDATEGEEVLIPRNEEAQAVWTLVPSVGDRVTIQDRKGALSGVLRFSGPTKFAAGEWSGVELDEPLGKNNGSYNGETYFECMPNYGVFVRPSLVRKADLPPEATFPTGNHRASSSAIVEGEARAQAEGDEAEAVATKRKSQESGWGGWFSGMFSGEGRRGSSQASASPSASTGAPGSPEKKSEDQAASEATAKASGAGKVANLRKSFEREDEAKRKPEEDSAAKKRAEAEAAAQRQAQEAQEEAKRQAEEEAAANKKAEEEAAAQRQAQDEAKRKAEDEAAAKKKAEEEAAARLKAEEEAAAKQKADEEAAARLKAEEEATAKQKADEEAAARHKAEEEAAAKQKADEEAAAKQKAEEEAKRRAEEEAAARVRAEEEEEEEAKRRAEEEAAAKQRAVEEARRRAEEEAAAARKAEEEAKRKADEEAALQKAAEQEAAKKAEEEAARQEMRRVLAGRLGAFSLAGAMMEAFTVGGARGSDDIAALPREDEEEAAEPSRNRVRRTWRTSTELHMECSAVQDLGSYLAEKISEGTYKPVDQIEFHEFLTPEVSESEDFANPFKVFVCTVWDLLNSEYYTHETNWPLACWHGNWERVGQIIATLQQDDADPELVDLVSAPIFVYAGQADAALVPTTPDGPGVSHWGVREPGEEGYDEQQEFWSTDPFSAGPHAWQLLARAELFVPEASDGGGVEGFKRLLRSAVAVYEAAAEGELEEERREEEGAQDPADDNGPGPDWAGNAIDEASWRQVGNSQAFEAVDGDEASLNLNKMGITRHSAILEEDPNNPEATPREHTQDAPQEAERTFDLAAELDDEAW